MILFFTNDITGNRAVFGEEESRHISQVLRKRPGEAITFVDGNGGRYEGTLGEVGRKRCSATIVHLEKELPRPFTVHLAVAPPKNISRWEWVLEKATEIGVEEITPLITARTERTSLRLERLGRIVLAAMKQSLKAWLPVLHEPVSFTDLLEADRPGVSFLAWCGEAEIPHLKDNCPRGERVTVYIGPEGDFTPEEVAAARKNAVQPVTLGPSRLRTETAALAACLIANLVNT